MLVVSRLLFLNTLYAHACERGKRKRREKGHNVGKRQRKKEKAKFERAPAPTGRVYSPLSRPRVTRALSLSLAPTWFRNVVRLSLFVTHRSILSFSLALSFLIHSATPFPFPFFHDRARYHAHIYKPQ